MRKEKLAEKNYWPLNHRPIMAKEHVRFMVPLIATKC